MLVRAAYGWWLAACGYTATGSAPGGAPCGAPRGPNVWCVLGGVLLSRTLAGAVPSALSGLASGFGMDTGRFPVAVTTETTTWAVRQCSCDSVIRLPANTHTRMRMLCVWLVVGLGVDRIVDALRMLTRAHPPPTHAVCVVCGGVVVCVGLLVPVSSKPLPVFHFWPINPVVCWGPTKKDKSFLWRPYLEDGFPLRCFQRLPVPNVANQPCPGRDNWHTRGSSVPVLSY